MNAHDNIGGKTAEEVELIELVRALGSSDGATRQNARRRLTNMGGAAVQSLVEALEDHREQVRWEAAKALGAIGDDRAAPALVEHLNDEDFAVRWLAAEALGAMQESALPALLQALQDHANVLQLREGAHHVLTKLQRRETVTIVEPVMRALDKMEPELTVPLAAKVALKTLEGLKDFETSRRS